MKKLILSLLLMGGFTLNGLGQIFTQNFNSSTVVADYISNTPNNGQFNNIGTSNANSSVSITSNQLRLSRPAAVTSAVSFSRTTDLTTPAPEFLSIKFGITLSGNTTASTSVATFQVGSGFGTGNSAEANSAVFARFSINISATAGQFTLRKLEGGATNSSALSGTQTLTLFINKTGAVKSYMSPNGNSETIAANSWDLWAGTTKIFDDIAALTSSVDITDFKFSFDSGIANFDIDDILIHDQTTVLPINLSSFTAKANFQNVDLAWSTASEQENDRFEILRSGDGKTFSKIGEVKGAGTKIEISNYTFTDRNALPGTSYYQLKQVDFNGNNSTTQAIAVKSNVKASNFSVAATKNDGTIKVNVYAANQGSASLTVYDLNGRRIITQSLNLSKGYNNYSLPFKGANGLYIASLTMSNETVKQKFIR